MIECPLFLYLPYFNTDSFLVLGMLQYNYLYYYVVYYIIYPYEWTGDYRILISQNAVVTIIVHIIIVRTYASLMDICAVKVLDRMYILRFFSANQSLRHNYTTANFQGSIYFSTLKQYQIYKKIKNYQRIPFNPLSRLINFKHLLHLLYIYPFTKLSLRTNAYVYSSAQGVCEQIALLHPLFSVHQGVCPKNDGIQERGFNSVTSELYISHYHFLQRKHHMYAITVISSTIHIDEGRKYIIVPVIIFPSFGNLISF